jgi:hypothetical protein
MLHAARLTLPHPMSGRPIDISCTRPPDFFDVLKLLELMPN